MGIENSVPINSNVPKSLLISEEEKKEERQRDDELVKRFKAGDKNALSEIMSIYHEKIFYFVSAYLPDNRDTEEVTQDTFIRVNRGLKDFRGESALSTWIYQIALNLTRNRYQYWRQKIRDKNLSVSLDKPLLSNETTTLADAIPDDYTYSPNDILDDKEFLNHIASAMKALTPEHRQILILLSEKHMEYSAIAKKLNMKVGTVKSRIGRARIALRKILVADFPEIGEKIRAKKI